MSDEIELFDPDDVPLPKAEVRIRSLSARPYPDGRRVRVEIHITPFQERPNLEFDVFNAAGEPAGTMAVIESMDRDFELTLHLRGPAPEGRHTLRACLSYPDGPPPVTAETTFEVVEAS